MNDFIFLLLLFLGFATVVAILVGVVVSNLRWQRERSAKMARASEELRLTFTAQPHVQDIQRFARFELFSEGFQWTGNLMQGRSHGIEIVIFDYGYSTRSPIRSRFHQTVLCLSGGRMDWPRFVLKPKMTFHRGPFAARRMHIDLGHRIGRESVVFDEAPAFSNAYRLYADDAVAVRSLFAAPILNQLGSVESIYIEGDDRDVVVCRPGGYLEPDQIGPFLHKVLDLTERMLARQGLRHDSSN
jgi:hypothetical protein